MGSTSISITVFSLNKTSFLTMITACIFVGVLLCFPPDRGRILEVIYDRTLDDIEARQLPETAEAKKMTPFPNPDVKEDLKSVQGILDKSTTAKNRRRAFRILQKCSPRDAALRSRSVTILIPSVTCFGRLLDAIKENFSDDEAHVFELQFQNTNRQRKASDLGSIARLDLVVDKDWTDEEVVAALRRSPLATNDWSILVQTDFGQFDKQE